MFFKTGERNYLWITDKFPLPIVKYLFMSSEHLWLRPPAAAGNSGPVSVSALYNALIWRHSASPQPSLETVYRQFRGETAATGTSSGVPHCCWKCERTPLVPCFSPPFVCLYCSFFAFSGVTTGMCRRGVPGWCWLFRENAAGQIDHACYLPWWVSTLHTHDEYTLCSRNPSTEALYSLFLCPIEWPNRTVETAEYRRAFCICDLTSHSTVIK